MMTYNFDERGCANSGQANPITRPIHTCHRLRATFFTKVMFPRLGKYRWGGREWHTLTDLIVHQVSQ